MSRGPNWPDAPSGHEVDDLDQLEELGDDAIIAQQTAAHAPQPRQNVSTEARSVVISDRPGAITQTGPSRRGTTEKTVIIRDRRKLDEMRQKLIERQLRKKQEKARLVYFWGAIGLAAFVLGGVVALFATGDEGAAAAAAGAPPEPLPATEPVAPAAATAAQAAPEVVEPAPAAPSASAAEEEDLAPAVDLEQLPVEKRKPSKKAR